MQDSGSATARAGILGQTERFEEALTHYNLAVDLQPKGKGALYNRGNILMGLDRFGEAGVKIFL
jgi:Flp pilus assembly protein TadD